MVGSTFGFKTHSKYILRYKITTIFTFSPDLYLPAQGQFAPPPTSPNLAHKLSSDHVWAPLLTSAWEVFGHN
jgi:hypothetical protein